MSRGLARMINEAGGREGIDKELEAPIDPPVTPEGDNTVANPEPSVKKLPAESSVSSSGTNNNSKIKVPRETSDEPDGKADGEEKAPKAIVNSTIQVVYHVEAVGPQGYLATVRRVGWSDMWRYLVIHYPTRMFLGVQFQSIQSSEDFMADAEESWDFSFNIVRPFEHYGISLEEVARLAGQHDGADMFGNRIQSIFHVET